VNALIEIDEFRHCVEPNPSVKHIARGESGTARLEEAVAAHRDALITVSKSE
jgi:hypothetical protein